MKLLNIAIGKVLAESLSLQGLRRAEAPAAMTIADLREITRTVNAIHQPVFDAIESDFVPFCVLVTSKPANPAVKDANCTEIDPKNCVGYRSDRRLAIVTHDVRLVPSVTETFTSEGTLLEANFPGSLKGPKDFLQVSSYALQEIMERLDLPPLDAGNLETSSMRLANCMHLLAVTHKATTEASSRDWNADWLEHVTRGLENLSNLLVQLQHEEEVTQTVTELLGKFTYAAFGLPLPKDGQTLAPTSRNIGRDVQKALETWWSSIEQVRTSIEYLRQHPDTIGEKHIFESLDWTAFEEGRSGEDNSLLGFLTMAELGVTELTAFAEFTERQFFYPLPKLDAAEHILVKDQHGSSLELPEFGSGKLHVCDVETDQNNLVMSESLILQVNLLAEIGQETFDASHVQLEIKSTNWAWVGSKSLSEDGLSLQFAGYFEATGAVDLKQSLIKPLSISIKHPTGDSLAGFVDLRSSAQLGLVPPTRSGIAAWRIKQGGQTKALDQLQPEAEDEHEFDNELEVDETGIKVYLFVWGQSPKLEAESLQAVTGRPSWHATTFELHSRAQITASADTYFLKVPAPKSAEQSPIIAAIKKVPLTSEPIDDQNLASLRGQFEILLSQNLESEEVLRSLSHFVVPETTQNSLNNIEFTKGIITTCSSAKAFNAATIFKVPEALMDSSQADDFRLAFANLGVTKRLALRSTTADSLDIPSRTSWKSLWDEQRPQLDAYLDSYANLIELARNMGNPDGVFWATYPFSFSIWDLENDGNCSAVLLSPLHPIRLAWLAGIEHTLQAATGAPELAGTVEGWNFPIFGPSTSESGALVAAPSDNGEGQLFLGWSVLVAASIDNPQGLSAPLIAGGLRTPGIAAGGMNSSSTTAALTAYRRINPHVSTLTVDLASVQKASRLREIDDAIMEISEAWSKDANSTLLGGFRIFDSLNRLGDPPTNKIQRFADESRQVPMVWSRYASGLQTRINCNVRLLQDSGVRLAVRTKSERPTNLGLVGSIPLRRFEAFGVSPANAHFGESRPALNGQSPNGMPFDRALFAAERAHNKPIIISQLHNAVLVDESAEWTVSGESMVSPSNLASMLNVENNGHQMLWEWRPPFLDSSEANFLERRPFLAVARIPKSFKEQLSTMLSKVLGNEYHEKIVDSLLSRLGSRGIGLSSLLAMGGTHASGALGFYLSLSLLETLDFENKHVFVLPLDACEPFLKALSGSQTAGDFTKRADLLLLTLDESGLTLNALEIKLYGLGKENPSGLLPAPGSQTLREAVGQVQSTQILLSQLAGRIEGFDDSDSDQANRTLWLNGLATLLEAAMKMSPSSAHDEEKIHGWFESLLKGEGKVKVGSPLITYFGHSAYTVEGSAFATYKSEPSPKKNDPVGLLSANVLAGFAAASRSEAHAMVSAWKDLVDWATGSLAGEDNNSGHLPPCNDDPTDKELDPEPSKNSDDSSTGEPDVPHADDQSSRDDEQVSEENPDEPQPSSSSHEEVDDEEMGQDEAEPGSPEESELNKPLTTIMGNGVEITVGNKVGSLQQVPMRFWPANTRLNQMNIGVAGDLGTGKTQFLKSLVKQLKDSASETQPTGISFLIFDYKDDYTDPEFVEATGANVLRPEKIPLNIFQIAGEYTKQKAAKRANAFCDVLAKIFDGVGVIQKHNLSTAIVSQFEINNGASPTLSQIQQRYQDLTGKVDAVYSILSKFTMQDIFEEDPAKLVSFRDLIDEDVLVVALSDFAADRATQNAIVVLFLDMYYEYMLESKAWPFEGEEPKKLRRLNSFLLVDEATNIMEYEFAVLDRLLLQGRMYGFGVILASQYLSHFKTKHTNYGEPLLTWIIHKVPSVKLGELITLGIPNATDEMAKSIARLEVHQALYSSLDVSGVLMRGLPFYELMKKGPTG